MNNNEGICQERVVGDEQAGISNFQADMGNAGKIADNRTKLSRYLYVESLVSSKLKAEAIGGKCIKM